MIERTRRERDKIARFPVVHRDDAVTTALVSIVRRLSTATSMQEIMEIVTGAGRSLLRADGMTFVLREGDLCHYAEEDAISPLWKNRRFPMHACISGWCMAEGKSAVIPDVFLDPRIPHDAYRPTFVRSLAMVPVRQEDSIAAIGAYWSKVKTTSPSELELLQTIANSAALAIANVQLKGSVERARDAERRTSLVAGELSHRVKNMLTVIDAIARQSVRHAQSLDGFNEAFSGRLRALSRSIDWLIDPGRDLLTLNEIVSTALSPFRSRPLSVAIEGPEVAVVPQAGVTIALITHELATNAVKYGALASPAGAVRICWTAIENGERGPSVRLTWSESGGPAVETPTRRGFGTTMLELLARHSLHGTAELAYEVGGITCTIEFPLRDVQDREPA